MAADPWVPPYLGTYAELRKALLLNPFLASPKKNQPLMREIPRPTGHIATSELPSLESLESQPWPSPWMAASSLLLGAIGAVQVTKSAGNSSIAKIMDDFCGTPPHPLPWWLLTAADMGTLGENMASGALRDNVLLAAGILVQKSLGIGATGAAGK